MHSEDIQHIDPIATSGDTHSQAVSETTHETPHTTGDSHHLEHAISLPAEPVFQFGTLQISNALFTSWIAVIIIILLSIFVRKGLKTIPGKLQSVFELLIEGGLSLADQVTGERSLSIKIFPIVFTCFLFILINNWLGIMPITAIGIDHHGTFVPFIRSGTADINATIALGLIAVLGSNIFGAFAIGAWKAFNKYFNINGLIKSFKNIRKEPTGPLVALISFFVGLLEVIGEGAKVASLSFRLFGNIFAGEVLLVSISGIAGLFAPIPFLFLEILVGVIQATVFSMLALVYFTVASHDHDHDNHEEHHGLASDEMIEEVEESLESIEKESEDVSRVFVPAK